MSSVSVIRINLIVEKAGKDVKAEADREQGAESTEQSKESRVKRAENREQKAKGNVQSSDSRQ
jgi:hypothetical protein